jgi:UDP-GlcNAc3NAcA epimerase
MKILSIIGARPQFVKAAIFRLKCFEKGIDEILLHTGQHYDPEMSSNIFEDLGVKAPDIELQVTKRTHGGMTGELLEKIEAVILDLKPDFINVYGDTNSTLAGALAAAKLHAPVVHIEAGLRSFNKQMPEEINRILTDHLSDYLFCPSMDAVGNLAQENIQKNVHHVGDIMYDSMLEFKRLYDGLYKIKKQVGKKIAVMTVHRADAVNDPERLKEVISFCESFTHRFHVVFPIHPNTKKMMSQFNISCQHIEQIDPIGYLEMQSLLSQADLVLTDSGGLQKEAYFHKCDCITLRDETEWSETIDAGWNTLWKSKDEISNREKSPIDDYGDGNAVSKILDILAGESK